MERAAEIGAAAVGRKRKVCVGGESEFSTSSIQLKNRRLAPENSASVSQSSANLSCETVGPDNASSSCCSSNGSSEVTKETSKFVDLEDNEVTVEFFATSAGGDSFDCRERSETMPLREAEAESGELESTARPHTEEKMPSEAELEEFFSVAEKNLQKKFIDKYNYDIVKDQPLEGRYEWVYIPALVEMYSSLFPSYSANCCNFRGEEDEEEDGIVFQYISICGLQFAGACDTSIHRFTP